MTAIAVLVAALAAGAPPPAPGDAFEARAREIERGLAEGRGEVLDLDVDALARRATAGVPAQGRTRDDFVTGMKRSNGGRTLGEQFAKQIREGGTVRLLRVVADKGGRRALFRFAGEGGLNYVEFHMERDPGRRVRVVDFFSYVAGENVSDTIRRMYVHVVAESEMGFLDRLAGKERAFTEHAGRLKQLNQATTEGRHEEALAAYASLPPVLQKDRVALIARIRAAFGTGDEARYAEAIEAFEAAFPEDPALDLVSIDGHFMRKEWAKALDRIDRLHARVKDPYLHVLRGSVLLAKGDRKAGKASLGAAIREEPTLAEAHWALVEATMVDREFAATAQALTAIERDAGVVLGDLSAVAEFAPFVASKEYRTWNRGRADAR
jgi:predicted negative regulator of RcsB-dependent stress response